MKKVPFEIIFEDNDILVIDKPSGISIHPVSLSYKEKTVVDFISSKIKDKNKFEKLRPGVVHRLDKETSGLLVIAKNKKSYDNLVLKIKKREVKKKYLVLVWGKVSPKIGTIKIPLERGVSYLKMAAKSFGKYAKTDYKVKEYLSNFSLLEVQILTGRTHQIRAHFSLIGFPVVGDRVYGSKKNLEIVNKLGLKRQFLHAYFLAFKHPKTEKWLEFRSELSDDLKDFLKNIKTIR